MELLAGIAGLVAFLAAVACAAERWGILTVVGGMMLLLAVLAWSGH
jgi:hypothetical protein